MFAFSIVDFLERAGHCGFHRISNMTMKAPWSCWVYLIYVSHRIPIFPPLAISLPCLLSEEGLPATHSRCTRCEIFALLSRLQQKRNDTEEILAGEEEEEEEEDASEYETDTDEDQFGQQQLKPVFVNKKNRETIAEREALEREELENIKKEKVCLSRLLLCLNMLLAPTNNWKGEIMLQAAFLHSHEKLILSKTAVYLWNCNQVGIVWCLASMTVIWAILAGRGARII